MAVPNYSVKGNQNRSYFAPLNSALGYNSGFTGNRKGKVMRVFLFWIILALTLSGCASGPASPQHVNASPSEVTGVAKSWGDAGARSSSTLSTWKEEIQGSNYALVQLRVDLDTYRFALAREQVELVIDAINNYQNIAKQTSSENSPSIGWLAKTDIKLERLGVVAKNDKLIVNVERASDGEPMFVLTFESWLLSFVGSDSPADRKYRQVSYTRDQAATLRKTLEAVRREM